MTWLSPLRLSSAGTATGAAGTRSAAKGVVKRTATSWVDSAASIVKAWPYTRNKYFTSVPDGRCPERRARPSCVSREAERNKHVAINRT